MAESDGAMYAEGCRVLKGHSCVFLYCPTECKKHKRLDFQFVLKGNKQFVFFHLLFVAEAEAAVPCDQVLGWPAAIDMLHKYEAEKNERVKKAKCSCGSAAHRQYESSPAISRWTD